MSTTEIQDTLGNHRDAYCLLALLSENTKTKLESLLDSLADDLDGIAWIMPREALHITLCEIIQAKEYSEDKEKLYNLHSEEYEMLTANILQNYEPIKVAFNTLEVSPQAIILRGNDNGSFDNIRRQLVDTLPLPHETKQPPTIIHSTIARFKREVPLNEVAKIVRRYSISLEEIVCEFKLIRVHVSPLMEYDTVRNFKLKQKMY